jgi:hypothetical protein
MRLPTSALIKIWKGKDKGFDICAPSNTIRVFTLRTYARKIAMMVWVPNTGIKATKTPTARLSAISWGDKPFLMNLNI